MQHYKLTELKITRPLAMIPHVLIKHLTTTPS